MSLQYKGQTLRTALQCARNQNKRNGHITLLLVQLEHKIINNIDYADEMYYLRQYINFPGILNLINNFCI